MLKGLCRGFSEFGVGSLEFGGRVKLLSVDETDRKLDGRKPLC